MVCSAVFIIVANYGLPLAGGEVSISSAILNLPSSLVA